MKLARPAEGWRNLDDLTAEARRVSEEMQQEGTFIRFVRSVFVPEDETCLYVYEASTAADVREAAARAGLPFTQAAEDAALPRGDTG